MDRILEAATALILCALATPVPVNAQGGDARAGGVIFRATCAMCHGSTAASPPGIGPRLFGVVGRPSGSVPTYRYSQAMLRAGLVWTPDQLNRYLAAPQATVPGNKMPYRGVSKAIDRENVVAYLATLR